MALPLGIVHAPGEVEKKKKSAMRAMRKPNEAIKRIGKERWN